MKKLSLLLVLPALALASCGESFSIEDAWEIYNDIDTRLTNGSVNNPTAFSITEYLKVVNESSDVETDSFAAIDNANCYYHSTSDITMGEETMFVEQWMYVEGTTFYVVVNNNGSKQRTEVPAETEDAANLMWNNMMNTDMGGGVGSLASRMNLVNITINNALPSVEQVLTIVEESEVREIPEGATLDYHIASAGEQNISAKMKMTYQGQSEEIDVTIDNSLVTKYTVKGLSSSNEIQDILNVSLNVDLVKPNLDEYTPSM